MTAEQQASGSSKDAAAQVVQDSEQNVQIDEGEWCNEVRAAFESLGVCKTLRQSSDPSKLIIICDIGPQIFCPST